MDGISDEKIRSAIKGYEKHAKENGFCLNPNRELVEAIVRGLIMNEERHGKRFCACMPITGNETEDNKTVCPCIYHMDKIKKDGKCHCGLFVKKEQA